MIAIQVRRGKIGIGNKDDFILIHDGMLTSFFSISCMG